MLLQRLCVAVLDIFCLYLEFNKILALDEFYFGGLMVLRRVIACFPLILQNFGGADKEIQIIFVLSCI